MAKRSSRKRRNIRAGGNGTAAAHSREVEVFQEAFGRWANMPPIAVGITMPREMALSLIGALQIVAHAERHTETRKMVIEIGRILQDRVCDAPELYLIIDTGWPDTDPEGE